MNSPVHLCCLSDKFVGVEHGGRTYYFERTAWAGWVSCTKDGNGTSREHPRGAWLELKRQHAPDITV